MEALELCSAGSIPKLNVRQTLAGSDHDVGAGILDGRGEDVSAFVERGIIAVPGTIGCDRSENGLELCLERTNACLVDVRTRVLAGVVERGPERGFLPERLRVKAGKFVWGEPAPTSRARSAAVALW